MKDTFLNIQEKIHSKLMWFTFLLMSFLRSPMVALADGEIKLPDTEVTGDGTVKFGGGADVDLNNAVSTFLEGGTQIFGWIIAIAGVGMMIIGGMQAYKASKAIQEGNQQGWGDTRNIIVGLIVGGALFAIIGVMVGFGVGFGNSLFK